MSREVALECVADELNLRFPPYILSHCYTVPEEQA